MNPTMVIKIKSHLSKVFDSTLPGIYIDRKSTKQEIHKKLHSTLKLGNAQLAYLQWQAGIISQFHTAAFFHLPPPAAVEAALP